jgi:hypothetical protein
VQGRWKREEGRRKQMKKKREKGEGRRERGEGSKKKIFPDLGRGPSAVITLPIQRDTIQPI